MDAFTAAFKSHTTGSDKFTRRMAIAIASMDGTTPRQAVLRCERLGLLREGSWDWFVANGGITPYHIQEASSAVTRPKLGGENG